MKTYIYPILSLSFITLLFGCSVDDVEPYNQLVAENTIRDEASAQRVLNGVYDQEREFDISFFPLHLAAYGNAGLINGFLSGNKGFNENEVPVENPFLSNVYNGHYKIINTANFLVEELEAGKAVGISEESKKSMISEARILRALNYFNLLRYFGEYYDTASPYGVVVSTSFSTELEAKPRNTVQEVYDVILEDLDYAIENGPEVVPHFLVGKVTAKALKAKVLLYKKDFAQAAVLANQVIDNGEGYALESDYAAIFMNSYNSPEVLFAPFHSSGSEGGTEMSQITKTTYSETLRSLADAQVGGPNDGVLAGAGENYDARFSYAYSDATKSVNNQGKYPFVSTANGKNNTLYYLRLAEIYLIHAEAETRKSGGDLTAALASLNAVRTRAGLDPKTTSTPAELLEDIREEKLLEMFYENGEPLFDVIRYAEMGDVNAEDIKPTLDQEYKYILPIPDKALLGNDNLEQNPGYQL